MASNVDGEGYKSVHVQALINSRANKLLTIAAELSGRTKTQEAKLRLHDHLEKYSSISAVNITEKRSRKNNYDMDN